MQIDGPFYSADIQLRPMLTGKGLNRVSEVSEIYGGLKQSPTFTLRTFE
jgi:hypothetical protein